MYPWENLLHAAEFEILFEQTHSTRIDETILIQQTHYSGTEENPQIKTINSTSRAVFGEENHKPVRKMHRIKSK